ncbi:hypothetical protein C1X61_03855 [Pseudomonas sp. FW215-T2]|nr:hypothetical protein C1X61_03855 [Pseudomonas sp. FW215-T2]PNA16160.1 hypothetical protein C1X62_02445 [Pseudomonas sp. FW215-R3]PNB39904.1 hypothetical protein C1X63_00480 [Pseudomonas sp. FW305-131]
MGAGLLAKASFQSTSMSTDRSLSRASPLPQGLSSSSNYALTKPLPPRMRITQVEGVFFCLQLSDYVWLSPSSSSESGSSVVESSSLSAPPCP